MQNPLVTTIYFNIGLILVLTRSVLCTNEHDTLSSNEEYLQNYASFDGPRNASIKFGKLVLPPNYDRYEIPRVNEIGGPLPVLISLSIRGILAIDQHNGEIKVEADFGMKWHDYKLFPINKETNINNWTNAVEKTTLHASVLRVIWKPDISIEQLASVRRTSILAQPVQLKVNSDGNFLYNTRVELKLRCDMNFAYFPADTQNCLYRIRSYSYTMEQLTIAWKPGYHAYLENPYHANFDVLIYNVEPFRRLKSMYLEEHGDRLGNYTMLQFNIKARRRLSYHLVQTYLPSFLLILITWVCFLLPSDMIEARIGISMTTVLTLTALFASVREQSPEVSYTMAVDVWMEFNIFLVFLTLLLFTGIYWMKRTLTKKSESITDTEDFENMDESTLRNSMVRYRKMMKFSKHYTFWIFAIAFSLFVTVYWICLIIGSRYLNFNPRAEFNEIPWDAIGGLTKEVEGRYSTFIVDRLDKVTKQ